jgi:hypothetical protein
MTRIGGHVSTWKTAVRPPNSYALRRSLDRSPSIKSTYLSAANGCLAEGQAGLGRPLSCFGGMLDLVTMTSSVSPKRPGEDVALALPAARPASAQPTP